jgi:hypothetical protein
MGPGPQRAGWVTFEQVDDLAGEFAERLVEAFHARPGELFHVGLTGGACARRCYEALARHAETQIDWWLVEAWWVDEAGAGPDDPESHYGMARAVLFDAIGAAYALHPLGPGDEPPPLPDRLDLLHLDLRPDGSLFSAGGRRLPDDVAERADVVVVTVRGGECAEALRAVQAGEAVPGARLATSRQVWLVERPGR